MNQNTSKEFRIKNGNILLNYIKQFSATEKAVFAVLIFIAGITAVIMAGQINSFFITEIPGYGGELHEGVVGLPRKINPILAVTDVDKDIATLVYSGLTRYKDGEIAMDLADSYAVSENGLVYTFKLKKDLKFHDGKPLTTEDIAFTIQKIQDIALNSPRRADWADVAVKVIDAENIQFSLKQPYSPFITNTTVGIIPKHIWKDVTSEQFIFSQYNIEPIGSGPYEAGTITRDSGGIPVTYKLSAWDDYLGNRPHLGSIFFHFFSDEEKALSALGSGSIDSLSSISSKEAAELASNSGEPYQIISSPLPRSFGVFFNQNQVPVLADRDVRIALNISVDRQAIINSALDGYGKAIFGPLPVDVYYEKGSTTPDIAGARALLEKNGWKRNSEGVYELLKKGSKTPQILAFDIYTADNADLKKAAEIVKQSWATLGAKVSIKVFEQSDLYQNIIRTRKYDALLFGELIGKDRDLYAFWHSSQRNQPGLNIAQYVNSKADKILEEIRITNSDKARAEKYQEFSKIIMNDVPAVFLYSPNFIYAVPKKLEAINLTSVSTPSDRWNSVENWYIVKEKVWKIFANNK